MRVVLAGLLIALGGAGSSSAPAAPTSDLIAFASNRSPWQVDHLFTTDHSGRHVHVLGVGSAPAVSPDRKLIAFLRAGAIWIMRRDGRNAHRVADGADARIPLNAPLWSPDGRRIAFYGRNDPSQPFALEILDLRTGRRTPGAAPCGSISWSPDGRRLACFVADPDGAEALVIAGADGSNAHPIAKRLHEVTGPSWSPDGKWLAYTSRVGNGAHDLFRIRPNGTHATRLTRGVDRQEVAGWSPNGRWLAALEDPGDLGSASDLALDLIDVRRLAIKPTRTGITTGTWRPDSGALMFRQTGRRINIYDVASRTLRPFRPRTRSDNVTGGAWLGSRHIVFSGRSRHKDFAVYTVRPNGSGLQRLTSDLADDSQPAWSPDGARLTFVRGRDQSEICTITLGQRGRRCFGTGAKAYHPQWSPDGRELAYVAWEPGGVSRILLRHAMSGSTRALPPDHVDVGGASWSPAGDRLVFASGGSLFIANVATGAVGRVTNGNEDRWPTWSPDDSRIVFWSNGRGAYFRESGIFQIDPTVGEASVQKIPNEDGYHPAIAPDAKRIAVDAGEIEVFDENGISTRVTHSFPGTSNQFPAWRPNS